MKYYIQSDLGSLWNRVQKSSYVDGRDTMMSWLKIMEDGQMFKITRKMSEHIINAERISEEEREEDEREFYSDLRMDHFKVPILIKNSAGKMVILSGKTHFDLMIKEEGSCKVWLMTRERWKE